MLRSLTYNCVITVRVAAHRVRDVVAVTVLVHEAVAPLGGARSRGIVLETHAPAGWLGAPGAHTARPACRVQHGQHQHQHQHQHQRHTHRSWGLPGADRDLAANITKATS